MSVASSVKGICKSLLLLIIVLLCAFTGIFIFKLNADQKRAVANKAFRILSDVPVLNLGGLLGPGDEATADPNVQALSSSNPGEETYDNFGDAWPKAARPARNPRHKVISEDPEKKVYVYESPGYHFYADEPIAYDASMHFATLFETTREFVKSLPLGMIKTGPTTRKSFILIFGKDATYYKSGGPRGSGGCYLPMKRLVLVPVSSLQLRETAGGFERDERKDHKVLIHELVHQLTPAAYYAHGSVGWFSEGLAEYVGTTPYHPGYFWVDPHGNTVKEYVTSYGDKGMGGLVLGDVLRLPPLKEFMLMSYRRFTGSQASLNYGASLVIVYYFFHLEGGGGAKRITEFLKGLKAGEYGEAALAPLHGGEGFAALEADITRAWAAKGLNIRFGK